MRFGEWWQEQSRRRKEAFVIIAFCIAACLAIAAMWTS